MARRSVFILSLALLVGLLAPSPKVLAGDVVGEDHPPTGVKFTNRIVPVYSFVSDESLPYVIDGYAAIQAAMPSGGPLLPVIDMEAEGCEAAEAMRRKVQSITVCEKETLIADNGNAYAGIADPGPVYNQTLFAVSIYYDKDYVKFRGIVCHEGMHGVGILQDHYGSVPESCVYGSLPYPGSYDAQMLLQLYGEETPEKHRKCGKIKNDDKRKQCKKERRRNA